MYYGYGKGDYGFDKGYFNLVYINLFDKKYVLVMFIYSNVVL